nr:hypothetical protein [Lactiplantibacillus plantarum]
MTVAIRYQTRNGNTQAFAEQIASVAGVPAQSIDTPVEQADTLFFWRRYLFYETRQNRICFYEEP